LDRSMITAIGASGAISEVLGAYMVLTHGARSTQLVLLYFVRIVTVPRCPVFGILFSASGHLCFAYLDDRRGLRGCLLGSHRRLSGWSRYSPSCAQI
jgi:membrane associated rhomboid family serine protease